MRRLLVSVCLTLPLLAQTRAGSETLNVMLVEIPVNVIGRDGKPVRGLTAANFEVLDGNEKRVVSHLETVDFSLPEAQRATPPPARRNFLLLFDLNNITPATMARSREAAARFVATQVGASDRVAVASTNAQSGLRLLAGFTTDRSLARYAIDSIGAPQQFHARDPLLLTLQDWQQSMSAATGQGGGRSRLDIAENYKDKALQTQRAINTAQLQTISRQLDQMSELGRLLDRVGGRKQVVLLSEGFDARMLHGREQLGSAEEKIEQQAVESGDVWRVDTENRYGNTAATSALGRMVQGLRRSDVILHAVDIKGLRSDVDASAGIQHVSNESLSLLTRDTGGTVFKNANNLSDEFARMLEQQEVTYILAFQAPLRTPGKFHDVKVRLVDVPGARVFHRLGYYEPSIDSSQLDRTLTAGEIVMNRLPVSDVAVSAVSAAFPASDGKFDVPVVVEIDGATLLRGAKDKNAGAEIFIYAFDEESAIRDFAFQQVNFDLAKVRNRIEKRGVKFYNTLRLEPGEYSIRTLVRNSAGKHGFRETAVRVASDAASAVVIDESADWLMVKAPDRQGAGPYPFMINENQFVPAAMPVLTAGRTKELALIGHNLSKFDVDARVGTQTIPLQLLGRTEPRPDGRVVYLMSLTAPQMVAGEHQLVLNVRGGGATRTLSIPVRVE